MSVIYPHQRGEWWAPQAPDCYLCGDTVPGEPAVMWAGIGERLLLHRSCAGELGMHLIADAREADLATRPGWARRAARAAGWAMRAQEMTG